MPLFNSNSKLEILNQVKEIPFQLERQIQHLVEANLNTLLGLEFVKSEFTISGSVQRLRIDTLAFDGKIRLLSSSNTSRIKILVL